MNFADRREFGTGAWPQRGSKGTKVESGNEAGLVTAGYFGRMFYRRGAEAQKQAVDRIYKINRMGKWGGKADDRKA